MSDKFKVVRLCTSWKSMQNRITKWYNYYFTLCFSVVLKFLKSQYLDMLIKYVKNFTVK